MKKYITFLAVFGLVMGFLVVPSTTWAQEISQEATKAEGKASFLEKLKGYFTEDKESEQDKFEKVDIQARTEGMMALDWTGSARLAYIAGWPSTAPEPVTEAHIYYWFVVEGRLPERVRQPDSLELLVNQYICNRWQGYGTEVKKFNNREGPCAELIKQSSTSCSFDENDPLGRYECWLYIKDNYQNYFRTSESASKTKWQVEAVKGDYVWKSRELDLNNCYAMASWRQDFEDIQNYLLNRPLQERLDEPVSDLRWDIPCIKGDHIKP
jgi:hypothetical protein